MVETAIILRVPAPAYVLWAAVAAFGAMTVLSYAILGEFFPKESVGRANAALNLLHIGGAFVLQSAIGFVIDCWPANAAGHYPDVAYQAGLALPVGLQLITLLWFARSALVPRPEMSRSDTAAIAPIVVSDRAVK